MDAPNPTRSDATTTPATADDDAAVDYSNLPPDIVADIHARLTHLDRLTVAAVFGAAGHSMNPEAPWLAIPGGETTTTAPAPPTKLYSISDRRAAAARAGEAAMRGCFFLGGSGDGGWLVIADKRSRLRMVNPVTGAHRALPAITTCPFFYTTSWAGRGSHVNFTAGPFMRVRHGGGPPPRPPEQLIGTSLYTVTAGQVRQYVYRKVVLSAAARPGSYAAMLVLAPDLGAPMFATSDDPAWRVAPSRDGVEDAIHHRGRFYSITYTGVVEEWDRRGGGDGGFTSRTVATAPLKPDDLKNRKYIAAAPDGKS
uniref:KIB1-4 beta-propeller domain-containing protein n=1 Tax=Oryza glaberrima TaxID=4538 RepID=I1PIZ2_ORYGL